MRKLIVALSLAGATAAADPQPMSAGLVPEPTADTEIRMTREDLEIELTRVASVVKATIVLENPGAATQLLVGFPCAKGADSKVASLDCKTPITVTVDGKKIKAKAKGTSWLWPMSFTAGQKATLVVSYSQKLRNERYEQAFNGMGALHYRLVTGAKWAGPIGELYMTVKTPTESIAYITPAGYTRERGKISWALKDHEPKGDLVIVFHPRLVGSKPTPALAKELRAATREGEHWVDLLLNLTASQLTLPAPKEKEIAETIEASAKLIESTP